MPGRRKGDEHQGPSPVPAAHAFSGQLAVTLWAWDTLEGLEETCFLVQRAMQGPEAGWSLAGPT